MGFALQQLFIDNMKNHLLEASIIGKEITREALKNKFNELYSAVTKHFTQYGLRALLPDDRNFKADDISLTQSVLELIGWSSFSKNEKILNPKPEQEDLSIAFFKKQRSHLHDKTEDYIFIQKLEASSYDSSTIRNYKKLLNATNAVYPSVLKNYSTSMDNMNHNINFMLSHDLNQFNQSIGNKFYTAKGNEVITNKFLEDDIIYYTFDNQNFVFLVSVLVNAKSYTPNQQSNLPVKYLLPQTDKNIDEDNVGQRNASLPPQYINSAIIPIVKENKDFISVLLYCSDSYNFDVVRKLIWFIVRLTNGCANEYRIYLPDYDDEKHHNEIDKILKSFENEHLEERLSVHNLEIIVPEKQNSLSKLPITSQKFANDESYENLKKRRVTIHNKFVKE